MSDEARSAVPAAVPVLPVADLTRSLAFYERLGFAVRARFADEDGDGYAILGFEGAELHLAENAEIVGSPSWSGCYLRVVDADATFAAWTAVGAPVVAPPADQDYGIREFATEDPDHNLWRVGSPLAPDPDQVFVDEFAEALASATVEERPARTETSEVDRLPASGPHAHGAEMEPVVASTIPSTPPPAPPTGPSDGAPGEPSGERDWFALVSDGETCPDCRLANGELHARAIGAECRDLAHALGELLLGADDDAVRARPTPDTWSALEYGVHVRDSMNVFAERIVRALAEHDPQVASFDREGAIADGMANESDVGAVADDLGRNASKLSEALRMVTDDDWDRPATVGGRWPFTIELMARVVLHELVHHTRDVRACLAAAGHPAP